MPVKNIFSKRNNPEIFDDNYVYDELPKKLRVQIIHIIFDTVGIDQNGNISILNDFKKIYKTLCREWGVYSISNIDFYEEDNEKSEIMYAVEYESSFEKTMDIIEEIFIYINTKCRTKEHQNYALDIELNPDEAINELNIRFKESSVGYQFENNQIIRIDNTYIHSEIIKPTLTLLNNAKFELANEEYMEAMNIIKKVKIKTV